MSLQCSHVQSVPVLPLSLLKCTTRREKREKEKSYGVREGGRKEGGLLLKQTLRQIIITANVSVIWH